ncbi:hypothetical protein [Streptomyces chartreusis]|uniref:hypothetical protein n=1 Tax=Streptomyces chartreusis TaxID=1969 RepID=UPI00382CBC02
MIAAVLRRFDVVAVHEVRGNLRALQHPISDEGAGRGAIVGVEVVELVRGGEPAPAAVRVVFLGDAGAECLLPVGAAGLRCLQTGRIDAYQM